LYILISCAQTGGDRSYGDVAQEAFGSVAQAVTTSLVAIMLHGSLTADDVLVKDIWTPVIISLVPNDIRKKLLGSQTQELFQYTSHDEQLHNSEDVGSTERAFAIVLAAILVLCSPLLLQRDLHSLRHTCYVGLSSCVLLMVAIILRATQSFSDGGDGDPCSCYLKIQEHKQRNPRSVPAWVLLIISAIAALICTRQALIQKVDWHKIHSKLS